jgi:phosphoglycerol transferase
MLRGILWSAVFAWAFVVTLGNAFELPERVASALFAAIILVLYVALKGSKKKPEAVKLRWTVLALLPFVVWFVLYHLFGRVDVDAILFHVRYDVGSNRVAGEIATDVVLALIPFALMLVSWWRLQMRSSVLALGNRILPVLLLAGNPLMWIATREVMASTADPVVDLGCEYVVPSGQPVAAKKNLIHVFVESAEATFWDETRFGNVAAPLKRLSKRGWTATGIEQVAMSGWTLAGQVSSTCGVPLFPLGVINSNDYDVVEKIMPDAKCLGDVLAQDGYLNVFMKGASLNFAGTRGFAQTHGYQRLLGFEELRDGLPKRDNYWGLHDEDLLTAARSEIETLRAAGKPFSLTITTIGGHAPEGYVSPSCETEDLVTKQPSKTLKAFACTNLLLERFINRLREDGLLENTVVVLQSDHLAMRNEAYDLLQADERRNMFMVLGSDRQQNQPKAASSLDIFPTILEELGYALPAGRAGLGYSLRNDQNTFVGQFGVGQVDQAIDAATELRDRLWGLVDKSS